MSRLPIALVSVAALVLWLSSVLQPALQTKAMQSHITALQAELARAGQSCPPRPAVGGAL